MAAQACDYTETGVSCTLWKGESYDIWIKFQ